MSQFKLRPYDADGETCVDLTEELMIYGNRHGIKWENMKELIINIQNTPNAKFWEGHIKVLEKGVVLCMSPTKNRIAVNIAEGFIKWFFKTTNDSLYQLQIYRILSK